MLISFSVENFKNFNESQKFSMIANNEIDSHPTHLFKEDIGILQHATIFGANGAGKTNLIDAMSMVQTILLGGIPPKARNQFCRTFPENGDRATKFEFEILKNNKFYAYGFAVNLKRRKILSEWVYELIPEGGSQKMLFERELFEERVDLGILAELSEQEKHQFSTYKSDFGLNAGKLFLSEMNQDKHLDYDSALIFFCEIYEWFRDNLNIIYPNESISLVHFHDELDLKRINQLIQLFDTGISKVSFVEIPLMDFKNKISDHDYEQRIRKLEDNPKMSGMILRINGDIFNLEKGSDENVVVKSVQSKHYNSESTYEFAEESNGTRRLFELFEIILQKDENKVFVIDEIDRSLHTNLLVKFLKLFTESLEEQSRQLIFTTHEPRIIDDQLLRRDEIWFVDRTAENRSWIYSLDQFEDIHNELPKDSYLLGRYGATPLLDGMRGVI